MIYEIRLCLGISALGDLSLVQWIRKLQFDGPDFVLYLLSVFPNVLAAIAIPFVMLSIWADQKPAPSYQDLRRIFMALILFAGIRLEFRALYFDCRHAEWELC